jgi:hypothetical protein
VYNFLGQVSISSKFYERVFCTKFWRQKLQSFVLALRLFGAKILYEKRARKTLMKLTADGVTVIVTKVTGAKVYPMAKEIFINITEIR